MPETRSPIELQGVSLAELQTLIDQRRLPPVDQWNPERCGDSGMRIARDGTWYHEGSPIRRPAMVRLFSTVLRREPDSRHVLVTPVEKLDIEVEATAFRAVEMTSEGEGRGRVLVRHGLEAELTRPLYYELAEIALTEGLESPGVWSGGLFFPLDPAE